jgi:hypothetical protein
MTIDGATATRQRLIAASLAHFRGATSADREAVANAVDLHLKAKRTNDPEDIRRWVAAENVVQDRLVASVQRHPARDDDD